MAKDNPSKQSGISRRKFLKGLGTGMVGSAVLTTGGLLPEEARAELLGPDTEYISGKANLVLKVNGESHRLTLEPRTTLLDALRDHLELTGTKQVCDRGQCGACTVMVDGKPVLSCMTLALDVREQEITTVEGIGADAELTDLQEAFVEKDALMCGFCTPGFVVAATSFLEQHPNPSLDAVKQGLSGNICRCGTYPKIFEAVLAVAQQRRKGGLQ